MSWCHAISSVRTPHAARLVKVADHTIFVAIGVHRHIVVTFVQETPETCAAIGSLTSAYHSEVMLSISNKISRCWFVWFIVWYTNKNAYKSPMPKPMISLEHQSLHLSTSDKQCIHWSIQPCLCTPQGLGAEILRRWYGLRPACCVLKRPQFLSSPRTAGKASKKQICDYLCSIQIH